MKPWEKYAQQPQAAQPPAEGPWTKYAAQKQQDAQPERGIRQRLYDNVIGDPNDGVQSTGEALASWLNRAGESMTFGLVGDEAAAAADTAIGRGDGYDERLAHYRQQEQDLGTVGRLSADIGGALVPGAGIAGLIGRAANPLARIGQGALAGAAGGATYGFMEGEGGYENRLSGAGTGGALGGFMGIAVPAIGAGIRGIAHGRAARRAVQDAARNAPTSEALRAQGNALYQQIDDAGVQVNPRAFDQMRGEVINRLRANTGFDELPGPGSLTPNSARVVSIMDEASAKMAQEPTAALPFRSLDQMRRQAGAAAGNVANRADQRAGAEIIEALDDFVQRLGPGDVVGGDLRALQTAIPKAREVWGRMSRSQMLDDAIEQSENYLGGGASGVRNQIARILRSPKMSRGFSDAEKRALRAALRGGFIEQAIGLAGGGIGRIAQAGVGAAAGGLGGAAAGVATGQAARLASEAMAMRAIEQARAAIASGALRSPEVMNRLAIAGQGAERAANALGFGSIPTATNALR